MAISTPVPATVVHLQRRGLVRVWLCLVLAFTAYRAPAQTSQEVQELRAGAAIERDLKGGEGHDYRLSLAGGQCAAIVVEQRGIDVVVQVREHGGKLLAEFDFESRKDGNESLVLTADSTVDYTVNVKARYPMDAVARYQVRVEEVRPATAQDRQAFEAYKLNTAEITLYSSGKYDDALPIAEHALALAEQAFGPDDARTGALLNRLALLQRTRGDYSKAEQLFQRALKVNQAALGTEHPQTAYSLFGLGLVSLSRGDYAKSEPLVQNAIEIDENVLGKGHPVISGYLMTLSLLHQNRQDLERSLGELQRAMTIAEATTLPGDHLRAILTNNLGNLYLEMGDDTHAEPLLESALTMLEQELGRDHPSIATPLQNLGSIARRKKQYARALEFLWRAEAIREKTLGDRHPQTAALLINIGNVYNSQGDHTKAIEMHRRALDILEGSAGPHNSLIFTALGNISRAYAAQGDISSAIEWQRRFDSALEDNIDLNLSIGSEREKLAYLSASIQRADRTVSLHVQEAPNDPAATELAALVLLQRKGRVLDAMCGSLAALRQRMDVADAKLLDEFQETTARLAKLALSGPGKLAPSDYRKQLDESRQRREALEDEISSHSAAFRAQAQPVTLAAVRNAIPSDAALLEFAEYHPFNPTMDNEHQAYGAPRYVVYILRQDGQVRWKDLGSSKEIDAAVTVLRQALRDPQSTDVRERARAADEKILRPLRGLIGDAKRLLISPSGDLNLVPFEAFVDEHGRYLVEHYAITYLTAGRDLMRMQVARGTHARPVVIADPFFGESIASAAQTRPSVASSARLRSITSGPDLSAVYFAQLPGTAREARLIKALFPDANVLTGNQATKAALQAAKAPSILHLATHGFFLEQTSEAGAAQATASGTPGIQFPFQIVNPLLRSGLALTGANLSKDRGILTALEAANLDLWGTRLVTLSACETGVGEVQNSEGVYGLRRAFFLAGAESLVMSFWSVSDYMTREIMTAYYTGLKDGLGRGEALRQAQLSMLKRKDRGHPFYWASFIQSGEWANLDGRR